MNLRILLLVSTVLVTAAGCSAKSDMDAKALVQASGVGAEQTSITFDKNKAAEVVLKDHAEFPQPGETKEIETMTGGPAPGTIVKGTLATAVELSSEPDTYIVTLTKRWNMTFNDKKLIGYWKYKVTPQSVQLVDSQDNTDLVTMVK